MNVLTWINPSVPASSVALFKAPNLDLQPEFSAGTRVDAALIFGGDGTVHRYLPQFHAMNIPALVVPKGSGNDLAHALGIHSEEAALRAWKQFCAGENNVRRIDLGVIKAGERDIPFCCITGAGLDSEANARANRMPQWLRGAGGYFLAVLQALFSYHPVEIELAAEERKYAGPVFLVAVGNAHRYGHGIKIVPKAELDDGLLDVCLVRKISKLKVFFCLPIIYFGGHTRLKEVDYFRTRAVRIDSAQPLELYADGEAVCRTPVEIRVLPRSLSLIVPV
jgi:diacylglycerol kinase (ATP)